jgi:hypothetical protein
MWVGAEPIGRAVVSEADLLLLELVVVVAVVVRGEATAALLRSAAKRSARLGAFFVSCCLLRMYLDSYENEPSADLDINYNCTTK